MAYFVTGAGGFLGQCLVDTLLSRGHKVLGFDFNQPKDDILSRWGGKARFVQGDIRDKALIENLAAESGGEPIIHLAGVLTAGCDRDPSNAIAVNVNGTYNVLDAALKNGKRRVVFASTIGVYGRNLSGQIKEDMSLEPDGWYGLTKRAAEEIGLLYTRRNGLDFRAVRFAAVTGPGRVAAGSASLFTSLIPEKAAKGEPYAIEVTPDTSYPVVYIKDAVAALLVLADIEKAPSRIYNIASGNIVVDKMIEYIKTKIPNAEFTYEPIEDIMSVVSGYKTWNINCERAKKELGWTAQYEVKNMVDDIIKGTSKNSISF